MAIKPFFIFFEYRHLNYNEFMLKINVIIGLFILELISDYLMLKVFKITYSKLYVLFLQVPKLCCNILCLEVLDVLWLKFITYVIANILTILFVTDSFNIKRMSALFFSKIVFNCSVFGFVGFMLLWINSSLNTLWSISINDNNQILLLICAIFYIFIIYKIIRYLEENKIKKEFLADVSFSIMGEHIKVYGLIDSGNSLRDPLTKKPIILISEISLKNSLSKQALEVFKKDRCFELKCETISSEVFIPIYKCNNVKIRVNKNIKDYSCMIGLVNKGFENGKYDCLLPRDFI